jgi:AmmeMemoRadiSam system protein A
MPPGTEHAVVALARQAIDCYLRHGEVVKWPDDLPPELPPRAGVFVSLKKHGALRGCIGTCIPTQPTLAQEIVRCAIGAAVADPRFPPLCLAELDEVAISVDILTPPEPIAGADQLDPARYGVIVRAGTRVGVLLPALPSITSAAQQLAIARRKGGIRPDEPVEIYRFAVARYA